MKIDRKNAMKIWEELNGKSVMATDFAGREINKSSYEQKNSKFGWTLTCLLPRSAGGKEVTENFLCVHMDTASEKGEDFPFFVAADKKYEILCDDDNEWVIEEAHDSESIAEQEAKVAAAMEKWDEIFGSEYDKAKDFCGRIIHKNEYITDSEFAWKIAPYVDSKPTEGKNVYIAHVLSVDEALGKTAFKANGKNYTLNKDNGAYYFKAIEIKPPKKAFSIRNPYDLKTEIDTIKSVCSAGENEMLDFLVIRAVTLPTCPASLAQGVSKTVSKILSESAGVPLACEISEMCDEQGARYMFITYRFAASGPADFERIFLGAQLLNTYVPLITSSFGLVEFKIYNHALFVNRAHVSFPVGLLSGYYPEFKALMDSIYGSAYGYYEGEPRTTLFVSNFIVYNVKFLSDMHPQGETIYFTEVYMVEHNYVEPEVSLTLQKMLAGEPENSEPSIIENEQAEPCDEPEKEDLSEPATEETVESDEPSTENEEAAEEGQSDVEEAPVTEESPIESEITDEADEGYEAEGNNAENGASIEPIIEENIGDKDDTEEEIAPQTEEISDENINDESQTEEAEEKSKVLETPIGEQLSMAFPPLDEETPDGSDDDDDGDGVFTLDLDSLD